MKKLFVLSLISALLLTSVGLASAQVRFKDVPDDHWAKDYVYDLVQRGITSGYPDGTFRGSKNITRYEAAVLISKVAKAGGGAGGAGVDMDAVKKLIQDEVAATQTGKAEGWMIGGSVTSRGILNKLIGGSGTRTIAPSTRIQLDISKKLGADAEFALGLDTRVGNTGTGIGILAGSDVAWGGTDILAAGMLDWSAKVAVEDLGLPLNIAITGGNGDIQHNEDKVAVSTSVADVGIVVAYEQNAGGSVDTTTASRQYAGGLSYSLDIPYLGPTDLSETASIYIPTTVINPLDSGRQWNSLTEVTSQVLDTVKVAGTLGLSDFKTSALYGAAKVWLNDTFGTGTDAYVAVHKIQPGYLTTLSEARVGVSVLDLPITDAAMNGEVFIDGNVTQKIDDQWNVGANLAVDFSGGSGLASLGTLQSIVIEPVVTFAAKKNVSLVGKYRYTNASVTSTTTDRIELAAEIKI